MINLDSLPVFLSASIPQNLVGTNKAQHLFDLMVSLVGGILSGSGTLVFGGHPSITPLIHRVAYLVGVEKPQIQLFQLKRFKDAIPFEANDKKVFQTIRWFPEEPVNSSTLADELGQMRSAMGQAARAAIFIGGKTEQYSGDKPGIRDEYERFLKYHSKGPVYLVGMLEGECLNIINNPNERQRVRLNSLQEDEINILQSGNNIDLIASIILKDLQRQAKLQNDEPLRVSDAPAHVASELETILLVAGDSDSRLISSFLEENEYRVLATGNADEALQICEQYHGEIRLLITDFVMPTISGRELSRMVKRLRPDISVLYLSGYTDDSFVHRDIQEESDSPSLKKPFTPDELTCKVRELLNRS